MKVLKNAASADRFDYPLHVTCVGCASLLEAEFNDIHFEPSVQKPLPYDLQQRSLTQLAYGVRVAAYFYVKCPICHKQTTVTPTKLS